MNKHTLKGNWNQLKGKVRERWGELTDDDLQQIHGKREQLLGKIQKAYGLTKDEAQEQIDAFEEEWQSDANRNELIDAEDQDRAMAGSTAGISEDASDEIGFEDEPRRRDLDEDDER